MPQGVARLLAHHRQLRVFAPQRFPSRVPRGFFTIHVEGGERLFLRAFADGLPYAWRALEVSSLEYEDTVRVLLEEGPQPETGATTDLTEALGASVGIELVGDEGQARGRLATATSEHGDTPAGWATALPGFGGLLPPLPPGRFRLSFARSTAVRSAASRPCLWW